MPESALKIKNPSWWKRRPKTEKYLIIVVGVLILLILLVFITHFALDSPKYKCKYGTYDICLSSKCVKTAAEVLKKIDLEANPCDDFYKFACGNFLKNTVVPEDKTLVDSFSIVGDKVTEQMRNLLEEPIADSDIKPFIIAKSLYQACMNTTEIESHSLDSFKLLLKTLGGWPVVEGSTWNEEGFNWISTTYKLMKQGIVSGMLLNFYIERDISDTSKNSLFLDQPSFELDKIKRKGFNETIFQAYYDYMVKVSAAFGGDAISSATEEMKKVAELVIALAKITVPAEERRNITLENNPKTIRELEEEFDYVPWLQYINTMLSPYKTMDLNDIVIVKIPSYYKQLGNILDKTSKRTLANYMYWSIVEGHITYLNDDLRNLELEFYKVISGIAKRPLRWKECTQQVLGLYIASGALYLRNFFNKEAKDSVLVMINYIRKEFLKNLETVYWMDEITRKHALDKIEAMYLHIAYPDELLDDQKLEKYYQNLTFSPSNYLGNMLNLTLFKYNIEFPQLDHIWEKTDWRNHGYAYHVAALYAFSANSIEFLAGILQDVFFDANRPKYMNYGAIGQIIGHEMTHAIDDEGRQFDKNGNLIDWWQPKTKVAFEGKARCIVDQYANITVPEIGSNLNGVNTQGENIADNGGIKMAYLAYKRWLKKHGNEKVLPGLPYTPEQMFWISVASVWCKVQREEQLKLDIMNDVHAPNLYRTNVPLMNSEYFAKDFGCSENSKMNPKHKCTVW